MKKKPEFLSIVSNNKHIFSFISVFLIFMFIASRHATPLTSLIMVTVTMAPMIVLDGILKYLLIPRFLHRTRWLYYVHSFIVILILTFLIVGIDIRVNRFAYINNYMNIPEDIRDTIQVGNFPFGSLVLHMKYLILLSITLAVVTISHLLDERKRIERQSREQQMLQELKFLRAQINPHFLFNALNCIYSLSLTQDEKAPDSIIKLSEMMRFVIDDCKADSVPILKEVSYINNYIDFQKIRMEKQPNIFFDYNIENGSFNIPPMLFLPIVENCFKHSRIIDNPEAYIKLSLKQEGNNIFFETENSKFDNEYNNKDEERIGIGLTNVRQRLELLFKDNYSFEVIDEKNIYRTKMTITKISY